MQNSQCEDFGNRPQTQVLKVCSRLDSRGGISDLWGELVEEGGKAPGLEACNEK